jgi:hypothetical protein
LTLESSPTFTVAFMTTPLVCISDALTPAERTRSLALRRALVASIVESADVPNGIALRLAWGLVALAEWIVLERRCCPFLDFELRWRRDDDAFWLVLSGPAGTKELLVDHAPYRENASFDAPSTISDAASEAESGE